MKCDVCQNKEATIQLHIQRNHEVQDLHLCQNCYQELRAQSKSPTLSGGFPPFPADASPFDGFLGGLFGHDGMAGGVQQPKVRTAPSQGNGRGILDELAHNISADASNGIIDGVIGRDREIARMMEVLNRRNKNNPVLIGEPGVGKTAIVEGLAAKIHEGKVPAKLLNKQIYLLDVSALVADTGIRGQFEQRMQQLIAELQQRRDVILFIDEVHLLVGAGSAQGSMDAGNILKPVLARGQIQVIGATTLKEYRTIEKDAALERRMQPILVAEPTVDEAIEILRGLQEKYERFHQVRYTDDAIRACVQLSKRYIQDRFLPDKAIDLMDEAGSKANLSLGAGDQENPQQKLEQLRREKEKAVANESYELAATLRQQEMALEKQLQQGQTPVTASVKVDAGDIQAIVEDKTGIPVGKLQESEQHKLKDLEIRLASRVMGQDEAVAKVAKAIRRSRAGLKAANRPIGSFLFAGPTGVGKTELAKRLAEELFGSQDAMIRLDMSEYMEKHSVSKLIGSPPGYVGYEDAGQLTERVRRNPYSLILLDEIEKAHPDVQHAFLQIMEDGRLTDSQGRVVSFKDTIVIMTSNAGTLERKATLGFGVDEAESQSANQLESLKNYFKLEFLNRFDAIVQFRALGSRELEQIVGLMLQEVKDALKEQRIELTWSDAVMKHLAKVGYHPAFGARPLRRVIQEAVEDKIADALLDENNISEVILNMEEQSVVVTYK